MGEQQQQQQQDVRRLQFEDNECYGCQLRSCVGCPYADLDDEPEC